MFELKKFIKVKDVINSYKERRIAIKESLLKDLENLDLEQFLYVNYKVSSPPEIQTFEFVKDNNIVAFARDSLKEKNISLEELNKA